MTGQRTRSISRVGRTEVYVDATTRARRWATQIELLLHERSGASSVFTSIHVRESAREEPEGKHAVVFHFEPPGAGGNRIRNALCFWIRDVTPELLRFLLVGSSRFVMDEASMTVTFGDCVRTLSEKQFSLIKEMYLAPHNWTSRAYLLHHAFETTHRADSSIVRVHIHNLRAALTTFGPLLRGLRGVGYRLQLPQLQARSASGERVATHARGLPCCDSPADIGCGRGITVLVVDDDAFCARWVSRVLRRCGFDCHVVRWWDGERPGLPAGRDVGVFDVFLGDESGVTLADETIQDGVCRAAVLMSAFPARLALAGPHLTNAVIDKADGEAALIHAVLAAAGRDRAPVGQQG